ncbi:hypothetical protein BDY19DRAFT_923694, partial [Irpex rosettiformis]
MKIEHIECQVICDGEALTEYQEKSDSQDQKTKSCYIVSDVGKRFVVRIKSDPHKSDISCHLWIDGQRSSRLCCRSNYPQGSMLGFQSSQTQLRPFIFSSVTTVDDDRLQETISSAKDFGTLCIKIYRVSSTLPDPIPYDPVRGAQDSLNNLPVHEKSKKAGSHRVILGDPETKKWRQRVRVTYTDPIDSPYYTFTWRYLSKGLDVFPRCYIEYTNITVEAMLQAQGIVPQDHPVASSLKRPGPSTPSDNSSKRPRTDRSASQDRPNHLVKIEDMQSAREFQARRDALKAQRAVIEAQEAALEEEVRQAEAEGVKREPSPIVLGAGNGDVIDLTEDD